MQDVKTTRTKITAAERLERQALSYRKQLHDSQARHFSSSITVYTCLSAENELRGSAFKHCQQERRISAKSGREALPPTPADLAADEKLRIQGEETAEAAKNAIADAEEILEILQVTEKGPACNEISTKAYESKL